jgi:hypothetical protein
VWKKVKAKAEVIDLVSNQSSATEVVPEQISMRKGKQMIVIMRFFQINFYWIK